MIFKLNDKPIDISSANLTSLGDVLAHVKGNYFGPREFISAISVNGEVVPEVQQGELVGKPIAELDSLEIVTDNSGSLSIRTLDKMDGLVSSLINMLEDSADKFRIEDEKVANQNFIKSVEALQTFVEVIVKVKALNELDYGSIIYESEPVSIKEEALLRIFNTLHETQKDKDWINLADIIEYELVPMLNEWKCIFPILSNTIKKSLS